MTKKVKAKYNTEFKERAVSMVINFHEYILALIVKKTLFK